MGLIKLMGGAMAATFVFGAVACYGTADTGKSPEVVGERAEIVAQKRDWLRAYDKSCEVCFEAFEQCGKGANDQSEIDACKTALDACVRGGLVKDDGNGNGDADGGAAVDDGNGNAGDENGNAGGGDIGNGNGDGDVGDGDVGDGDGDGDGNDADAGVDDGDNGDVGNGNGNVGDGDIGDGDGNIGDGNGNVGNGDGDSDSDTDEATEEALNPNNDGDADGRPGDQVKGNLIEDVKACLDTGESCIEADGADLKQCVTALRECVKAALDDAFENVCSTQHRRCREQNASTEETGSVEDLCNAGIDQQVD
jgi:hypothetical protein